MDIIDERYQNKSTIMVGQVPVWNAIMGEGTIADALLDRMVNSSHRIALMGESLRKMKRKEERGRIKEIFPKFDPPLGVGQFDFMGWANLTLLYTKTDQRHGQRRWKPGPPKGHQWKEEPGLEDMGGGDWLIFGIKTHSLMIHDIHRRLAYLWHQNPFTNDT